MDTVSNYSHIGKHLVFFKEEVLEASLAFVNSGGLD